MDSNFSDVAQSYRIGGQAPLDSKNLVNKLSDLKDLGTNNFKAFTYYRGMVIFCNETKTWYTWVDVFVPNMPKLLQNDFEYPSGSVYDSEDYSYKKFNFVNYFVYVSMINNVLQYFGNKNIGNGVDVFSGIDTDEKNKFSRISETDSISITKDEAESILISVKQSWIEGLFKINGAKSSGTGIPIYDGIDNKEIKISSLKSNNIKIEKLQDGTIYIDNIEFGYLKSYYVNNQYVPTQESPSDGSVIRPFTSFNEARNAVIGNGNILNPENVGARIIMQTSSSTAINPTVNTITIELQNASLTYTGPDLYMFDTEILYPLVPKDINGEITQSIYMNIVGNGGLYRNNGIGIVRSVGAKRGTSTITNNPNNIYIRLGEKISDEITISENDNYPDSVWEGQQMKADNVTTIGSSYNPPYDMRWTTKLNPTTPLIMAKGSSFTTFSFSLLGEGRLNIYTLANIGLWVEDTLVSWNKLHINPNSRRITVQNGTVGVPGYPDVYQPKDFPAIYAKNANFYINSIYHTNGGTFNHHGWKNFIKIEGTFNLNGTFNYDTNYYIETFANLELCTQDFFQINGKTDTSNLNSRIRNLLKTPLAFEEFNLICTNSVITGVANINEIIADVIPKTKGTLASINDSPYISDIIQYNDDAAAIADGKLKNALYLNLNQNLTTL